MAGDKAARKAELEAELAALDTDDDEPEFEYEIGRGDNYARVSSKSKAGRKIAGFFKDSFGIDLADEPVQEAEPDPDAKDDPKRKAAGRQQQGGQVRAFRGRGVS
jgi:hypothetical protein